MAPSNGSYNTAKYYSSNDISTNKSGFARMLPSTFTSHGFR
jgi:hypothetical protein